MILGDGIMDLLRVEGGEESALHSADDCHQHYGEDEVIENRPVLGRVEVLLGKERRRRWSPDQKAEITAASCAWCEYICGRAPRWCEPRVTELLATLRTRAHIG
jgi:hypothetical protein